MVLSGHTLRVGDDVTAARIVAPEHWDAGDPALLAAACLEAVDPALAERVREGDILLAGERFGAGAGQEHAVLALQAAGFAAVVCASADAGFVREAHALGLAVLQHPEALLPEGAIVRLDLASGGIEANSPGMRLRTEPLPEAVITAVRQAQLLQRMRRVVEEEGFDG
jgi:3-isopropylmalate/(R)-2-methylmalate dehydratase small subunit